MLRALKLTIVLFAAAGAAGCAGMSLPLGSRSQVVRPTQANPVMDVMTIWEAGEGRGLDNLPSRGIAGQLMFFTYNLPSPALVEGTVTVYLFDDQGSAEEQSRPLWQHTFAAAEWNAFVRQTNLGTAYQLFVPYVRKGQEEAHCSVRIKYEPSDGGPPVYSKMANVTLPGSRTQKPVSTLTRQRIEPQHFDADHPGEMRPLAEQGTHAPLAALQTSTVALPGNRGLSAATAARLQQVAHEMIRDQASAEELQQAGYATESSAADEVEEPHSETQGGRYRLYR